MKPSKLLAFGVVALVLCIAPVAMAQPAGGPALAAITNDAGGIRVVVKPKAVAAGGAWEFEVTMDTHTKPLDADLTKTATIVDNAGRNYIPFAWQGDAPGGHHRKGALRFSAPSEQIKSFELQIQGLGGESKRAFQWTLK
jgi:hypothetical protein